jgi:hypothetical protein
MVKYGFFKSVFIEEFLMSYQNWLFVGVGAIGIRRRGAVTCSLGQEAERGQGKAQNSPLDSEGFFLLKKLYTSLWPGCSDPGIHHCPVFSFNLGDLGSSQITFNTAKIARGDHVHLRCDLFGVAVIWNECCR